MADPPPITYTPQFQPPTWQDNVDLVWFEGPNGFDAQFKSLRKELDVLSGVVKQLSDTITSVSQTANSMIQAIRWGYIKADGTILSGSKNFRIARVGIGLWDIFFDPPFSATPAIQATEIFNGEITHMGGNTLDNAVVVAATLSQCRIKVGASTGAATDRHFSFMAYGPSGGVSNEIDMVVNQSSIAVVCWGSKYLDVYGIGTDKQIYHRYWNGSQWLGWEGLGGTFLSPPSVVQGQDKIERLCGRDR